MESILQIKRDNRMIEGQVTYEEGDLIEAVFPSLLDVTVGDQLPCLMTSDYETISNFEAVVVAKEKIGSSCSTRRLPANFVSKDAVTRGLIWK